ncbi:glycoside hydrolase/phage tail family protein [Ancylobacter sp. MQZ15Z-1]|uniref:Glycoside hydrolase/phage tail family protein n=1 Tax=Ancylobacter mangrovi TaxID=2972472 RepID=A0A9X2PC45_9HYPH|nr:glycoside hydrolase/phage tail family protein [Ancylobacter mangrovi]MCS0494176.1 glycoside hydrolase/phage tail family protein [Ancylobacter mangrovi]
MATLLLGAAGAAVGGALLGPIGAVAGRAIGALGGAALDNMLFTRGRRIEGPRLDDIGTMTSTEGAPIPRLYGRARLSGQVIWAAPVEEVVSTQVQSGGKGGTSFGPSTTTTTYAYFASFAVGLCEGPVNRIARIWADGQLLDTQGLTLRVHTGGEGQLPDPLIEAIEGTPPAYRGLAYLVFERLALGDFGNRLPQITVEVERAVGELEKRITAMTLIPGATEFGYDTREIRRVERPGVYEPENRHTTLADTDFEAALDHLLALCPNLRRVALVVSWFGDDLRAGQCRVRPGVERRDKPASATDEVKWKVAGEIRAGAYLVSQYGGHPAYGGTPSDESVMRAIQRLNARGLAVTLYPFVMMDVPVGNTLPDPWSGAGAQPTYPWRGRITCDPAPGRPGSPDATATAGAQVAALFGSAAASDYAIAGGQVIYSGPEEWTLRRMALHYAKLSVLAGGVEAILIGSEMAALTRVRSASGVYPAVDAYAALAAQVKAVVGAGTNVGYAADWTEYTTHVLDGGAEVRFPLDPLWASAAIDFVGIDWYAPVADWRDGDAHLDAADFESGYDRAYLAANVRGGEGFDWYYPDDTARLTQSRVPITDGAYGEPWVFRQKDIAAWWGSAHHERAGGVRSATPTAWVPGSKPVRLTEFGCAAVDKGANRPSVFPDPKSVESGLPPFSNGQRDDLMQRRHLEATLDAFATTAANPPAGLPSGRMLEADSLYAWTWDARPYPVFPLAREVWADGANWETGHWLSGRLGSAPLAELCAQLAADFGIAGLDSSTLRGVVDGYVVDRPMSVRAALEPLASAFAFDLVGDGPTLRLVPRGGAAAAVVGDDDIATGEDVPAPSFTRTAESELPRSMTLSFVDGTADYRRITAGSRRLAGQARADSALDIAMVAPSGLASGLAEMALQDAWAGRESVRFALPPSFLALEPGDVLRLDRDGRSRLLEITEIEDREARLVSARGIDPSVLALAVRSSRTATIALPAAAGPPEALVMGLPTLSSSDPAPVLAHLAAFAAPWPGALAVWRSLDGASFERIETVVAASPMGETLTELAPGPNWHWNRGASLDVELYGGALAAASDEAVLGGANALVLRAPDGGVEILQFQDAELIGASRWRLRGLLRGQLGTEARSRASWPAGTRLVRLDANLVPVATGLDLLGRSVTYRVGRADRDHGDAAASEVSASIGPAALLPLAPVHARARRTEAGIELSWIRRTRIDGDSWELVEVPLGEASEAYRVELLNGTDVVRSATVGAPPVVYGAADELADFGAPQSYLDVRIAQVSASVGPGTALETRVRL